MIVVDSSVWIDYFRGANTAQTNRLDRLLGAEPVAIGDLILTEVLQGFPSDREFDLARRVLSSVPVIELGGQDIAVQAARNYRELRARGLTGCKTIDTIIATRCIESGLSLLYSDRDFAPFAQYLGLLVADC